MAERRRQFNARNRNHKTHYSACFYPQSHYTTAMVPIPLMSSQMPHSDFRVELTVLLNRHCSPDRRQIPPIENGSNTPDHILADYLHGCLRDIDRAILERDNWHSERHRLGEEAQAQLIARVRDLLSTAGRVSGESYATVPNEEFQALVNALDDLDIPF